MQKNKIGKIIHLLFVIGVFAFLYLPIVVLFIFSFNLESFPAPWNTFSLKWYQELLHSPFLWNSFLNSIYVASCSTAISLLLSVFLIFYVEQGGRIKKCLPLYYGNVIIPETVLAVSLLGFFMFLSTPLGLPTLIVAHSILGVGFVIPVIYARYVEIDPRIKEASLVLGATPTLTFFKVTLPMLKPSLLATGLLVFIISFDDFILAYFCAGSSSQTLSLYIMSMLRTGISPVVNALSVFLLGLSSLLALLFFSLKSRPRIF